MKKKEEVGKWRVEGREKKWRNEDLGLEEERYSMGGVLDLLELIRHGLLAIELFL